MKKIKTPICTYVTEYASTSPHRLHMPGHKGTDFLGIEKYDITETDGADVLYHSVGIIRESEEIAASLFGAARTVYSAEGSSLSIRAMLYLAVLFAAKKGERPLIAAGRNAHKVFVTAAALLDFDIRWLYGEKNEGIVVCNISAEEIEEFLSKTARKPCALYITSPDYLGNVADIGGIAAVCKRHGVLLLVDNAHGAYLNFLSPSRHPMALGADMCCDSAHKTLPVLTGGGYLHISHNASGFFVDNAEKAMSLFASTSPSYLILQSLDLANAYIGDGYRERLSVFCEAVSTLKERLTAAGFTLCGDEPLKITLDCKPYGYRGDELAEILSERNIICEFSDPDYLVLMVTPESGTKTLEAVGDALTSIVPRTPIAEKAPKVTKSHQALTPRQASLSPCESIPVAESVGRILASANVGCPPAIPIVVCGERIDENAAELFGYYGIEFCDVVTE